MHAADTPVPRAPTTPARTMTVRYEGGENYEISVRGHRVLMDQPIEAGGADTAPTPTELFVASLAGCVAFYAGRYHTRHGLSRQGLGVSATYRMATGRPARVTSIHLTVHVPGTLPAQRWPALQAVVEHCTVHNSLTSPPTVRVDLTD
ncbi:OsmC family protein [Streptosporangiaceae bacterium NEAU-GS5]|nr:OsmC family protein [Streptosporangiaceae bacterium NEAU-GS5]